MQIWHRLNVTHRPLITKSIISSGNTRTRLTPLWCIRSVRADLIGLQSMTARHALNLAELLKPDAVCRRGICYGDVAVCVSVTLMYCAQTTESVIMQPSPDCSPAILVFPRPNMNLTARGDAPHWGRQMIVCNVVNTPRTSVSQRSIRGAIVRVELGIAIPDLNF